MKIEAFGLSDVGKKRTRNEDSFLVSDDLNLYVVADGMGGHSGGEYASRLAVATIEEVLSSMNTDPEATVISGVNSEETEFGDRLKYAIEVAGQKIFDQALYDPDLKGMGTTITSVLIDEKTAYVANVGDSRVYLAREGEKLEQLTQDHSLVSEQMQAGLISETDAKKHKLKNIITRSVGYQEEVEIDLKKVDIKENDKILLCSDGLTNMLDDEEINEIVLTNNVQTACRKLIKEANNNGGDDNITVVVCSL
ncbi:MAG: Stp1/IreP family PP2C-type Ser/Thr phosphatase [bacterium]|nr:Stp1/IreP family PP2C-type Ser/Thr phosphatase [bacterium]MBU1917932.1 Stp1/IreP family PP2C-type Ser/Thr phosphatase [bacterium]